MPRSFSWLLMSSLLMYSCKAIQPTTTFPTYDMYNDSMTVASAAANVNFLSSYTFPLRKRLVDQMPELARQLTITDFAHAPCQLCCYVQWKYSLDLHWTTNPVLQYNDNQMNLASDLGFRLLLRHTSPLEGCCPLRTEKCGHEDCNGVNEILVRSNFQVTFDQTLQQTVHKTKSDDIALDCECTYLRPSAPYYYGQDLRKFVKDHLADALDKINDRIDGAMQKVNAKDLNNAYATIMNSAGLENQSHFRLYLNLFSENIPAGSFSDKHDSTNYVIRTALYCRPYCSQKDYSQTVDLSVNAVPTAGASGDINFYVPSTVPLAQWQSVLSAGIVHHRHPYGRSGRKSLVIDSLYPIGYSTDTLFLQATFASYWWHHWTYYKGKVNLVTRIQFDPATNNLRPIFVSVDPESIRLLKNQQLRYALTAYFQQQLGADNTVNVAKLLDESNRQIELSFGDLDFPGIPFHNQFARRPASGYKLFFSDNKIYLLSLSSINLRSTMETPLSLD